MSYRKLSEIVKEYALTGDLEIDIDLTLAKWDRRWYLSQYEDKFTLCYRKLRQRSNSMNIQISTPTAQVLIVKLKLVQTKSEVFRRASSWRREGEYDGMK